MRITRVEFDIGGEEYILTVSQTNLFCVKHRINHSSLVYTTLIVGGITDEIRYHKMAPIADTVFETIIRLLVLLIGGDSGKQERSNWRPLSSHPAVSRQYATMIDALIDKGE